MFNIIEKFLSIDGEGPTAGEIATFIRFQGCNLRCSWCDTTYSFSKDNISEVLTANEIYEFIKFNGSKNVTLTGGEPLHQQNIDKLLDILNKDKDLLVHIETNGSIDIFPFKKQYKNLRYIVDFKLPESKMEHKMNLNNLNSIGENDVYKFVVSNLYDLEKAYEIIKKYKLDFKCKVYISPVLGEIDPKDIVEFMKEKKLNNVKFQIQLHKVIWDKDTKGV